MVSCDPHKTLSVDTADTMDNADTVDTVDTVDTIDTADTVDTQDTVDTVWSAYVQSGVTHGQRHPLPAVKSDYPCTGQLGKSR